MDIQDPFNLLNCHYLCKYYYEACNVSYSRTDLFRTNVAAAKKSRSFGMKTRFKREASYCRS